MIGGEWAAAAVKRRLRLLRRRRGEERGDARGHWRVMGQDFGTGNLCVEESEAPLAVAGT